MSGTRLGFKRVAWRSMLLVDLTTASSYRLDHMQDYVEALATNKEKP